MNILGYMAIIITPYILCLWTRKMFLSYQDEVYKNNMKCK